MRWSLRRRARRNKYQLKLKVKKMLRKFKKGIRMFSLSRNRLSKNDIWMGFAYMKDQCQKWIIPFTSYETTYFLFVDGMIFMELRCSEGSGCANIDDLFSMPVSMDETMPFLALFWEDFSFVYKYCTNEKPSELYCRNTSRTVENGDFLIEPTGI